MRWLCFLIAAVVLATTAPALAQSQDDQEARMRFDLGNRYYEQGRFLEAAAEFEAAYAASDRDALLYNMFISYRDGGNDAAAADALRRYLATNDPEGDRRRNLESRLATIEARLAGGGGGGGGGDSTLPIIGGVIAGVGVVEVIISIPLGVMALDGAAALESACPGGNCPSSEAGRISETHALSITADVLWTSGAILAAGGAALLIVGLVSGGGSEDSAAAVTPSFGCTNDGCAASVGGRF